MNNNIFPEKDFRTQYKIPLILSAWKNYLTDKNNAFMSNFQCLP